MRRHKLRDKKQQLLHGQTKAAGQMEPTPAQERRDCHQNPGHDAKPPGVRDVVAVGPQQERGRTIGQRGKRLELLREILRGNAGGTAGEIRHGRRPADDTDDFRGSQRDHG